MGAKGQRLKGTDLRWFPCDGPRVPPPVMVHEPQRHAVALLPGVGPGRAEVVAGDGGVSLRLLLLLLDLSDLEQNEGG